MVVSDKGFIHTELRWERSETKSTAGSALKEKGFRKKGVFKEGWSLIRVDFVQRFYRIVIIDDNGNDDDNYYSSGAIQQVLPTLSPPPPSTPLPPTHAKL